MGIVCHCSSPPLISCPLLRPLRETGSLEQGHLVQLLWRLLRSPSGCLFPLPNWRRSLASLIPCLFPPTLFLTRELEISRPQLVVTFLQQSANLNFGVLSHGISWEVAHHPAASGEQFWREPFWAWGENSSESLCWSRPSTNERHKDRKSPPPGNLPLR